MFYIHKVNEFNCVSILYYTRLLQFLQIRTPKFIALKCEIFKNKPQEYLGACINQSSGLYSVTAFRQSFGIAVEYQIGLCNRVIVDEYVELVR